MVSKGQKKKYKKINLFFLMVMCMCIFCSCSQNRHADNQADVNQTDTRVDTGFVLTGPDSYDSADTAIISKIDKNDNTITFLNLDINRKYTLEYDGTTHFYDKCGSVLSLSQIDVGEIVDVTFLKSKKHLTTLSLSANAWTNKEVNKYSIDTIKDEVIIGADVYKLSENTLYFSDGRAIDEMDLNSADTLTFKGIDTQILSISVEKGHGYLRLKNDASFIDGWIEIGQSIIQPITEDMLLTVPEGSYQVNISKNGSGGVKSVVINRNQETTLDIGDLKIAETQYGNVLFSVTPDDANVYVDGSKVDISAPVNLSYGIHQLIVKAEGYQSITKYLNVGQESAGIDIELDLNETDDDDEDSTVSGNDSAVNSGSDALTDYYKVYIDAPKDVEVYVDGNYVGISPCSFKKVEGSHNITLRKSGYETRSYTIQVENDNKDFSFSFADLISLDE